MSEGIIKVLDALAEKFGLVIDWTSSNVIPYLQQLCGKYINYEITTSIVWIVLGLLLYITGIICYKIVHNHKDWGVEHYSTVPDDCFGRIFIYFGVAAIFIISIIIIITQVFDIVTCFTFPEKMIIDELMLIYSNMK